MLIWVLITSLHLLTSAEQNDKVRNIPKRYEKDYRLFCSVCNNFVSDVKKEVDKETDHHGYIKHGFRLDTEGNKIYNKIDYQRSEVRVSEILDEDICKKMGIEAVLYYKNAKSKPGVRMLVKDEKYTKTSDHGYSKKTKYVNKAKTYCAEIHQRYYDELLSGLTQEDTYESVMDSWCHTVVDSRCWQQKDMPKRVIKKKKVKKPDPPKKEEPLGPLRGKLNAKDPPPDNSLMARVGRGLARTWTSLTKAAGWLYQNIIPDGSGSGSGDVADVAKRQQPEEILSVDELQEKIDKLRDGLKGSMGPNDEDEDKSQAAKLEINQLQDKVEKLKDKWAQYRAEKAKREGTDDIGKMDAGAVLDGLSEKEEL